MRLTTRSVPLALEPNRLILGIVVCVLNVLTTFGILYSHFKAGFIDPGIVPRGSVYSRGVVTHSHRGSSSRSTHKRGRDCRQKGHCIVLQDMQDMEAAKSASL